MFQFQRLIMKKQNKPKHKQSVATTSNNKSKELETNSIDSDSEEGTFSGWLKSGEGVELMKLFVICNSMIVFFTLTWPQLQQTFEIIYSMVTGEDWY